MGTVEVVPAVNERLRAWRTDPSRDLTLVELASQLGCSEAWLSLIERGVKVPGSNRLALAIQRVTGIAAGDWPDPPARKRRGSAKSEAA